MTPTATASAMPYQTAPMRLSVAPGAQPGPRIISMANQKGCSRPLNWVPGKGSFAYAALTEARPVE